MLEIQTLDKNLHDRKLFDCGSEALNTFLREQANSSAHRYISRTKVLVDTAHPQNILGFYSLSYAECEPPQTSKLYKNYRHSLPVLLLTRMGVDKKMHRRRIGEQLLLDAIFAVARSNKESLAPAPVIGLFVDAKEGAADFYKKYGFSCADPANPSRLWLPMDLCMSIYLRAHEN